MPAPGEPGTTVVKLGSPASILAAVPCFLGFGPSEGDLVVLGGSGPANRISVTLRFSLPARPGPGQAAGMARLLVAVLQRDGATGFVAAGYGPAARVTPVADALRAEASTAGLKVWECLRADGGRYWSHLCQKPSCCPPDGAPFDPSGHPVAAAFAAATPGPPLPSREHLRATIATVTGADAESMRRATARALERAARLAAGPGASGRVPAAGRDAVTRALARYRDGGQLGHGAAAWLTVMLRDPEVRVGAFARMDPARKEAHLRLWSDMTRLAQPGFVAPAASLLALVAWQHGNGALANIGVDRALADDPGFRPAFLIARALGQGLKPSMADPAIYLRSAIPLPGG